MASFSTASTERLSTCDNRLIVLFEEIVLDFDCTILQGARSKELQEEYYRTGRSKVQWPNSKHNSTPSRAVDVAPWINGGVPWPTTPTDWNSNIQRNRYFKDLAHFYYFSGYVLGQAKMLDIDLRWGGDWDMDHDLRDNRFDDLVHFELVTFDYA